MSGILNFPEVATLASGDYVPVVASGATSKISLANLQKLLGGSGSSGTTSSTNLMPTPTDLSGGANSKWVLYSASGGLTRPGGGRIVVVSGTTTQNTIYVSLDPTTSGGTVVKGGQTYTFGATVTRAAGTGSGAVRCNTYYEGNQTNAYGTTPSSVTDGQSFRISLTVTVSAANGNIHIGFDFTPGGGDFTFTQVTLVAGSIDNPNAT